MDLGGGKTLSARKAEARNAGGSNGHHHAVAGSSHPYGGGGMYDPGLGGVGVGVGQAASSSGANVVGGVDIDALLNAAMGGAAPVPAAVPAAPMVMGMNGVTTGAGNANGAAMNAMDIANAASSALEAAFGGAAATSAVPPVIMPPQQAVPPYQQQQPQQQPQTQQQQTSILVLHNMVMDQDLATDEDYADLYDEVKGECEKFGRLLSMKIPRPQDHQYSPTSVKKIFLEYVSAADAAQAERELAGRAFGPNIVQCTYFDEATYRNGKLA
mmetsp:Transcript_4478/g.6828  ORF Transcript_4478/g.6828 Transcript_4478/m.6828 type:complete len:270 (+) Transcript_4478:1-810(+)